MRLESTLPLHNVGLVMSSECNTNGFKKTDVASESVRNNKISNKTLVSTNEVVIQFDPLIDERKASNVSYTPSDVESVFFCPFF